MAMFWGATRKCAIRLAFMSARCSHRRGLHPSWSSKRVGLQETSGKNLSARMVIRSTSFSSGFGTVRPVRIFATLQFGSTAPHQFMVASKSIWSIAAGLGYKENKLPFTLLTQRLPLRFLRENGEDCEALLFGTAGFLETADLDIYKKSAREYVRQLWDRWWPHRDDLQRLILSPTAWHVSGTRPLNHPQRRLAALAVLAREWPRLQRASGKSSIAAANDLFQALEHPFWNFHYTLTSKASPKEMALIGESRAADILANVLFPFWAAHELKTPASPSAQLWTEYAKLPAQLSNRRLETAATRLFGNDPRRKEFLRTVAHQQGLLQIYEDFCMQDNSDCAQCPFPEQMAKWT